MTNGYLGIVVPDQDFWQGYFINDAFEARARHMLEEVRNDPSLKTRSTVIAKFDLPNDTDQSILGSFCGTMVAASLGETENPETVIGVCGWAVREITQRNFFWIDGRSEGSGVRTSILPIYVSTIDEARDYINGLPLVGKIKRRLLARARYGQESGGREGQTRTSSMMHMAKRWPAIDKLVAEINRK